MNLLQKFVTLALVIFICGGMLLSHQSSAMPNVAAYQDVYFKDFDQNIRQNLQRNDTKALVDSLESVSKNRFSSIYFNRASELIYEFLMENKLIGFEAEDIIKDFFESRLQDEVYVSFIRNYRSIRKQTEDSILLSPRQLMLGIFSAFKSVRSIGPSFPYLDELIDSITLGILQGKLAKQNQKKQSLYRRIFTNSLVQKVLPAFLFFSLNWGHTILFPLRTSRFDTVLAHEVQIKPKNSISEKSEFTKVEEVHVEVGELVKEGELLVEMDTGILEIELEDAEVSYQLKKEKLDRLIQAFKESERKSSETEESQIEMLAKLEVISAASKELKDAKSKINYIGSKIKASKIYSPAPGRISDQAIEEGQWIDQEKVMLKLTHGE